MYLGRTRSPLLSSPSTPLRGSEAGASIANFRLSAVHSRVQAAWNSNWSKQLDKHNPKKQTQQLQHNRADNHRQGWRPSVVGLATRSAATRFLRGAPRTRAATLRKALGLEDHGLTVRNLPRQQPQHKQAAAAAEDTEAQRQHNQRRRKGEQRTVAKLNWLGRDTLLGTQPNQVGS